MHALILASSSIYRKDLLKRLMLPFSVVSPLVDETARKNELPQDTALRLAQAKAKKVSIDYPNSLIIGCDQVATLDNEQLGKPLTHANAVIQLSKMRGREVIFNSALCLYNAVTANMQAENVVYKVKFRALTDAQIENYLQKEQPYNCAGSAKSEGLGIALIESMIGEDPNGIPLQSL